MGKCTVLQIPGMSYSTCVCSNQSISGLIFFPYGSSLGIRKFRPQRNVLNYNFVWERWTWGFIRDYTVFCCSSSTFFSPTETEKPEFITSCTTAECMAFSSKLQRSNSICRLHLRCNCRRHHYHTLPSSEKPFSNKNYYELTSELSLRHKD